MRWNLRTKILGYLILLHLLLAAISVVVLIGRPGLLLVFEAQFVLSAVTGFHLVRAFFVPLESIRSGADLMREREFTIHFREVGQPEMDELVRIYNRMVDCLREERLKVEERNLFVDKMVRASPSAVVVLDHDGRIADCNVSAESIFEAPAEELIGKRPAALGGPVGAALEALDVDRSAIVPIRGIRLKCRRAEFYDRGAARSFFLIDELTDELRASEREAYGKVIRMMSHEVHNSVAAVRSLVEACGTYAGQLRPEDRGEFEQALEVAKSRLLNLSNFMNGLAAVVRVPPPDLRACDLLVLLRDLELLLRPELGRRRIRVRWETPGSVPDLSLDKNQMEEVLVNVLRNAMEAIGEDGEIVLSAGVEDGRPWLAIRDSGPGIDQALQASLFTPFFSTKREGRGVGLTLSREILTQHGFDYRLENHPAGGAEFRIRFGRTT